MRLLIFVHRWLGVLLCLFFLLWFPSGFVMMYWDYPSVTPALRFSHLAALDPATIRISPAEAAAKVRFDGRGPIRLTTFAGRPIYRLGGRGEASVVYADTGEEQVDITQNDVARIAQMWTGQSPKTATVDAVDLSDQWTLQNRVGDLQPLWKFSWPDGQQLYVSEGIGDVIQYTTRASRIGAYFGAIPHWLYFTPLRRNGPLWSRVVIWSSGIATGAALLGLLIAVLVFSPSRRYRYAGAPASIPYSGWKRWHTIAGLLVGVAAVTWAFSGLLSMEPFQAREESADAQKLQRALGSLRGVAPLERFSKSPQAAIAQLRGLRVKELEWISIAGEPVYFATMSPGDTRIVPMGGAPMATLDPQALADLVGDGLKPYPGARVSVMAQYDRYYLDRRRAAPLPVLRVELNDTDGTRFYVDPKSARVVGGYTAPNFLERWLYHGLHSMNFPWLYNYRPAWDIIVIAFMAGGTALAFTSLVLAWQVLGRKLRVING
ncbi:MAG TPA: hypothetical protein VN628_10950 [Vicinamibacterales bacterium]|nr:hypothetical protein [Vicinamibacterales bacterium]